MAQFKHTLSKYFGRVFINGRFVGNALEAGHEFATSETPIANGYLDTSLPLTTIDETTGGTFRMRLTDTNYKNFAMAWQASTTEVASAVFADVEVDVAAFELIKLDRAANITAATKESVPGTFVAAVEGVDYEKTAVGVMSLIAGKFQVSGTYPAQIDMQVFTQTPAAMEVEIHGGNKLDKTQKKLVRYYKVKFKPVNGQHINTEVAELEIEGAIEADSTRPAGESQFYAEYVVGQ
jgi:hypothetical protein